MTPFVQYHDLPPFEFPELGGGIRMYALRGRRSTVRSQADQVYPTPTKLDCAKYPSCSTF